MVHLTRVGLVTFYDPVDYIAEVKEGLESLAHAVEYFPLFKFAKDEHSRVANLEECFLDWLEKANLDCVFWFYNCFSQRVLSTLFTQQSKVMHVYYNPDVLGEKELKTLLDFGVTVLVPDTSTQDKMPGSTVIVSHHRARVVVVYVEKYRDHPFLSDKYSRFVIPVEAGSEIVGSSKDAAGVVVLADAWTSWLLTCVAEARERGQWAGFAARLGKEVPDKTLQEVADLFSNDGPVGDPKVIPSLVGHVDANLLKHVLDVKYLERMGHLSAESVLQARRPRDLFTQKLCLPRPIQASVDAEKYVKVNMLSRRGIGKSESRALAHFLFCGKDQGCIMTTGSIAAEGTSLSSTRTTSDEWINSSLLLGLAHLRISTAGVAALIQFAETCALDITSHVQYLDKMDGSVLFSNKDLEIFAAILDDEAISSRSQNDRNAVKPE